MPFCTAGFQQPTSGYAQENVPRLRKGVPEELNGNFLPLGQIKRACMTLQIAAREAALEQALSLNSVQANASRKGADTEVADLTRALKAATEANQMLEGEKAAMAAKLQNFETRLAAAELSTVSCAEPSTAERSTASCAEPSKEGQSKETPLESDDMAIPGTRLPWGGLLERLLERGSRRRVAVMGCKALVLVVYFAVVEDWLFGGL